MAVNSSFFDDISFVPPHLSSNSSIDLHFNRCFSYRTSIFVNFAYCTIHILLLPIPLLVLYLGYQQWRKQRSTSMTATKHCDIITYHSVVMQLNEVLGFTLFVFGGFVKLTEMMIVGYSTWSVTSFGQVLFQMLTCVERYLAVVHPVTYLGLKQSGGVKIRNITLGCIWVVSVGGLAVFYLISDKFSVILYCCIVILSLVVIFFCCISVVCALKRPGPGEVGGNKERVDQSKRRAFNTIMLIMGVLMFSFGGTVVVLASTALPASERCLVITSTLWVDLPSRLALPLLFLHRAGKLPCCKQTTKSG